jgi:large subunit ribosomal protein L21
MYAVIQAGGRQYKVSEGDTIHVDFFDADPGARVTFDRVLMTGGEAAKVGTPLVDGASVVGEVTAQTRGPKLIIFKRRRRKHSSMTTRGFKSKLTEVRIDQINA